MVVENKGGQSGNLGAEQVFNAEPDGYTLLASQPAPITTAPLLFKKLNFDPTKFEPVAVMSAIANTLLVRGDFPANNLKEFIAYVKANPGKLNYASQGNGTTSHLTGAMFDSSAGTKMNHVPYRGTAPGADQRSGRRPRRPDVQRARDLGRTAQGRQGEAPCRDHRKAHSRAAGHPDHARGRPELHLRHLERDHGAAEDAGPIVAKLNAAINDALQDPEVRRISSGYLQRSAARRKTWPRSSRPTPSVGAR